MASIPTNAFSAPRVRWVMQQKILDDQQKKSQLEATHSAESVDDVNMGRRRSESFNSSNASSENMDTLGEPALRPIFQRMHSSTLMVPLQRFLPVLPRPDFGRSLSHNGRLNNDLGIKDKFEAAPPGDIKHQRSRWSAVH